jgi:hypothetical protein
MAFGSAGSARPVPIHSSSVKFSPDGLSISESEDIRANIHFIPYSTQACVQNRLKFYPFSHQAPIFAQGFYPFPAQASEGIFGGPGALC